MPKILIIEDEPKMVRILTDNLSLEGYRVVAAADGESGLRLAVDELPDAVILDLMLPGTDGFEVCRRLRDRGTRAPILIVSARDQEVDKVLGLELGADDYITKPFSVRELLARVKAALRRAGGEPLGPREVHIGEATIDVGRGVVTRGRQEHVLGHYEVEILKLLWRRKGESVPRNDILNEVWGIEAFPTNRVVDNHIVSLRRKLEPDPKKPRHLLTVHAIGYKLVP